MTELLKMLGNGVSNRIWEKGMSATDKIQANASREARSKFILSKYVDRAFVQSHLSHADSHELLANAISTINIKMVLRFIADGESLNDVPALHLALGYKNIPPIQKDGRFIMAEFLLQNGANVDGMEETLLPQLFGDVKSATCGALHCAAALQDVEAISYLLDNPNLKVPSI